MLTMLMLPFRWMRKTTCVSRTILYTLYFLFRRPARGVDLSARLCEIVRQNGFSLEAHQVTTKDGYILTLHRIRRLNNNENEAQPAIFLQHGLVCSSAVWLLSPNGLAYLLAQNGFDVWMGNFRGNTFSRKHEILTDSDAEYWQFCWDQHGAIDLPAMIDHVLKATRSDALTFVGHSMGTTALFIMLSEAPQMNARIKQAVMLAPVTMMKHMNGFPKFASNFMHKAIKFVNK